MKTAILLLISAVALAGCDGFSGSTEPRVTIRDSDCVTVIVGQDKIGNPIIGQRCGDDVVIVPPVVVTNPPTTPPTP